ncbi:MAG TPA: C13 family peptidase [Rhizomicrobium sp.]
MFAWFTDWLYKNLGRTPPVRVEAPPPADDPWSRQWRVVRNAMLGLLVVALAGGGIWYWLAHRTATDWAIIVVSGDWHAHDGGSTEAFDNARRDVSAALASIGFPKENIEQFSSRPDTHPGTQSAETGLIGRSMFALAEQHKDGCLFYFTSHGSPQGVLLGGVIATPQDLLKFVGGTCGDRPTIVVVSACYSGVFVPAVAAKNRMVMTAARPDRTSFGCGQDSKYPYFDTCMLETIHKVHSFPGLALGVRDCVSKKEDETGMSPPSEPQIYIPKGLVDKLPRWN